MRNLIRLLGLLGLAASSALHAAPCAETQSGNVTTLDCESTLLTESMGASGDPQRQVKYLLPDAPENAPPGGWPVVIMYHGTGGLISFKAPSTSTTQLTFGTYYQVQAIRELVNHGYAVIAPPARNIVGAWQSNDGTPTPAEYALTEDFRFLTGLFGWIADKKNALGGKLFAESHMHATGISSGGYNTSRMAVSFPTKFRSLTIASASYATCRGYICSVPALPSDHPPTLFLHGNADLIVPVTSMEKYYNPLAAAKRKVTVPGAGHQWVEFYPAELLSWVMAHP